MQTHVTLMHDACELFLEPSTCLLMPRGSLLHSTASQLTVDPLAPYNTMSVSFENSSHSTLPVRLAAHHITFIIGAFFIDIRPLVFTVEVFH